ncbi:unnamed protein product [Closterium sp. NIES-54]
MSESQPLDHWDKMACPARRLLSAAAATAAAATAAAATTAIATTASATIAAATAATVASACCAAMALLRVLAFNHDGRPIQFDTWLDDLPLYLLSNLKDSVSLFDPASGAATAPPATADSATRSQWLTRDAAARIAIRNHLPLAECAHFGQHRTPQALYDTMVTRYSSPATAALGRLLLPNLFPELSAFATVEDLVSHLRTSDARYRATVPAEFLDKNQPPMFITLYFIVTRLIDSLRSVRDHFLSLDPTSLTIDLLEEHLLAAETSAVAVGAARGTPRTPFSEGCSPSPLAPSYACAAAADVPGAEDVGVASSCAKRRSGKGKGGMSAGGGSRGGGGGSSGGGGGSGGGGSGGSGGGSGGSGGGGGGGGGSGGSGSVGTGGDRTGAQRGGARGGQRQWQQHRSETPSPQQLREWLFQRGASGGSVSCPYVIHTGDRAGQTSGKAHTHHLCFSSHDDAWRAEFGDEVKRPHLAELLRSGVAIFDLNYVAILCAMYAEGDCYRCVPPDPRIEAAALGASESVLPGTAPAEALHTFMLDSGLHLPSFSMNLVSTAALQDAMVTTTTPGGQLASAQVSTSSQVAPPCSCRLLSHQTLLWHHRLGHPSLPRLRGMHSRLLVYGLPRSLPPLPPSPAPPCLPCVEGRQRASPHSLFPSTTAPLQTLHIDSISSFASGSVRTFLSCVCTLTEVQNGIAERRIGLVMEVARTSMIHAAASHFLWPFAVRYAAHQLKIWPRVSFLETLPTLRWTGKVGDASMFRDVTFDESVPFYRLFPYRSTPPLPPPLFLAPGPPPVDPLPGTAPVEVAVGSGAARGAVSGGAASRGAEPGVAEPAGVEPGGAAPKGVEPGGAESEGAESGGAEPQGAALSRAMRAGGAEAAGAGGAGVTTGAGGTGGTAATGPEGALTRGTGAAGFGGVGGAGAGDPTEPEVAGAGGSGAGGAGARGAGAGGTGAGGGGAGGAGVGGTGARGAGAGGARVVGLGDSVRPRPYFIPLLQQVLGLFRL